MLLDHMGAALYPDILLLRIIGRLAFPLFSFFVYEGFRHTHSRIQYLSRILSLGILCAVVYYLYSGEVYANVLLTFSISIVILYGIHFFRKQLDGGKLDRAGGIIVALGCLSGAYIICSWIDVDYGFLGAVLPAFAAMAVESGKSHAEIRRRALLGFAAGLIILSVWMGGIQIYSLLALPLLAFYNGSRGKISMKRFFYWFYPAHLAAIGVLIFVAG